MRILVADGLAEEGLARLRESGDLLIRSGLSEDELAGVLPGVEALIVRSRTRVSAEAVKRATCLRVIARAGVGVDNIDVEAATRQGILVLNTPESSTIAAAEHTLAMLLALVRRIPQAQAALVAGRWTREKFIGSELFGKTLGVVGLGKIGSEVARRAAAFGMRVLAYDPYITPERAHRLGVELGAWDDVLDRADVLTLHVPLAQDTKALIGRAEMAALKPGALLVNCARGGLIDEEALLAALEEGRVGGAALDVFTHEPPPEGYPLLTHPRVVVTPHLGGSTLEAQRTIAVDIADQVLAALRGEPVHGAVNAPALGEDTWRRLDPFMHLARRLGELTHQVAARPLSAVAMSYEGEVARMDTPPLTASYLTGLLHRASDRTVNLVNAVVIAKERGLAISEARTDLCEDFTSQIVAEAQTPDGPLRLGGTLFGHREARITRLNRWRLDLVPAEHMLFVWNEDRPGMIGAVGTILGRHAVNIANMHVGRRDAGGTALMVLTLDAPAPQAVLEEIQRAGGISHVRAVQL
ncbi:MAG TPA: phosphoglycerate dehydrogenase [bacterium]|nr:phosphoglycerate dehydrogenase [bacterium]